MGVPRLSAGLAKQFPMAYTSHTHSDLPPCDSLYMDFNANIHVACQRVMDSAEASLESAELEMLFVSELKKDLKNVLAVQRPSTFLCVSIDGVAPTAKISHQRKRRHKTVKEKEWEMGYARRSNIKPPCSWDTNAITPGTGE